MSPIDPTLVAHRRRLLGQVRAVVERERCGPDLHGRCGCTFVPWSNKNGTGIALILECDQAHRLFEAAIKSSQSRHVKQWETHIFFAREDADNQLKEIIKLIVARKALHEHPPE